MAFVFVDRARMTSATTGTGSITLGAAVGGFQSFAAAGVSNGDTFRYVIEDGDAWETGTGTLSGSTVARTLISSSTGSLLSLSGQAEVFVGLLAGDVFTPAERTAIADNTAARHTHSNKATLDASTAAFTTALKDKLDAIAEQATKNQTDVYLLARGNQTGTQAQSTITNLVTDLAGKQASLGFTPENAANKNANNGYAGLDSSGKLLASALPALAITDIFEVANQAAMLALTAQVGDIAIRSDQNKTYGLAAEPASTLANWKELRTPTDVVQSVAGLTGTITAAAVKAALALAKGDVGLNLVDNTADSAKPVSTAQATAIGAKVDKAGDDLTGGFTATAVSDGTKSSGTYTPSPSGGNFRKATANGAFLIAAPTVAGCYNMTVDLTNGASAGPITFSGFIAGHPKGDSYTTGNGHKFKLHISKTDVGITATLEALQ